MSNPKSIEKNERDYLSKAWEQYTMQELGCWVHLLSTRSTHRATEDKRLKDLGDAQAYLDMMQAKLNQLKGEQ